MNDDLRMPIDRTLYPPVGRDAQLLPSGSGTLPSGAFTASVLFDVLSLVAESSEQARSYKRRAVDLLKLGLGASLAALALALVDSLKVPAATPAGKAATRQLAVDGAVTAVYLLNLAARQKQLDTTSQSVRDSGAIGLSLVGLTLLGASGKL